MLKLLRLDNEARETISDVVDTSGINRNYRESHCYLTEDVPISENTNKQPIGSKRDCLFKGCMRILHIPTFAQQSMLTGPDLLAKVKELGDVAKSELVRECGYVSTKKDGGERLNFTSFYEALLEAKGVSLGGDGAVGKGGRKLSYTAKVQGNGNLLVGKAYTAMLDLSPGDEFDIKLGKKAIRLIPVGGSEEETEE